MTPLAEMVDAVTAEDSSFKQSIVDNGGSIISDDAALPQVLHQISASTQF